MDYTTTREPLANFSNAFERLTWIREQKDIPGPSKAVLVWLMSYANIETGQCFPSIATLARASGFSPKTVHRSIKWLEAQGYVSIEARRSPFGDKDTSIYTLIKLGGVGSESPYLGSESPYLGSESPRGRVRESLGVGSESPIEYITGMHHEIHQGIPQGTHKAQHTKTRSSDDLFCPSCGEPITADRPAGEHGWCRNCLDDAKLRGSKLRERVVGQGSRA